MRSSKNTVKNILFAFLSLSLAACGSYQAVTYDDDGIYTTSPERPEVPVQQAPTQTTPGNYTGDGYFANKLKEYENNENDNVVFTDVDGYSSQSYDPNSNVNNTVQPGWGNTYRGGTNIYLNSGWGWGGGFYDPFWNGGFGWGWGNNFWNRGFYGNPYWNGGFYGGFYGGGFYNPYGFGYGWGNPYWGNRFWRNGYYGNRNYAYVNSRRGSYTPRYSTRNSSGNTKTLNSRSNSRVYTPRTRSSNRSYTPRTNSSSRARSSSSSNSRTYTPRSSSSNRTYTPRSSSSSNRSYSPSRSSSGRSSGRSSGGSYRRR